MGKSQALVTWRTSRANRLDEFVAVHGKVGGTGPGRRHLTEQLNRGFLLALAAQFQGFCRDLHSEGVAAIIDSLPVRVQPVVALNATHARQLDRGNPRAGALGSDFGRLGVELWPDLRKQVADGSKRHDQLEQLMIWRNAIAHESQLSEADLEKVGSTLPNLAHVKSWRANLNVLANNFDLIVGRGIKEATGLDPW